MPEMLAVALEAAAVLLAFGAALAVAGYGLTRLLAPEPLRAYALMLMPAVGASALIVGSYFLNLFVNLVVALGLMLTAAVALDIWLIARRGWWLPRPTRPQWVVLGFAAVLLIVAFLPHLHGRSLAMLGLNIDEELYVLSGALTINGVRYGEACYAHLPAGFARQSASASGGAVVLTYLSGVPESATGAPPPGLYKEARLVTRIEVPRMNDLGTADFARLGSSEFDPTGLGTRILREDPETGEVTWIMGCDDGGWTEKTEDGGSSMERHPVVEEIFVVAGAMTGNVGTLYPGAYFWRPPDI